MPLGQVKIVVERLEEKIKRQQKALDVMREGLERVKTVHDWSQEMRVGGDAIYAAEAALTKANKILEGE